jgi:hypothetical protein
MAISHRKEVREDPSMKVTRIGLDIAKQIFELHGVDRGRPLPLAKWPLPKSEAAGSRRQAARGYQKR